MRRLKNALAYGGQTEKTVLLEEPGTLDAELLQEEEAEAKAEAEKTRPGLTMFTDGSKLDGGATEYSVVWKGGLTWVGAKVHMGSNQEAYGAECAALAHALEVAARRNVPPERVTIFSDAQAAITRMASDEPGPGQQYDLLARKYIAMLRSVRPGIVIEIRWCLAHKGVTGNEKAMNGRRLQQGSQTPGGRMAKLPGQDGCMGGAPPTISRQLQAGNLGEELAEARQWAGGRTSKKKYRLPESQRPDGAVAGSSKRLASRFYQIKTGHCLTGQYLNCTKSRPTPQCWWPRYRSQTRDHLFKECPNWKPQQKILRAEAKKETRKWKDQWKVRNLLADGRCSRAVLDFLSTTDVGRRVPGWRRMTP